MKDKYKISAAIPTFYRNRYLEKAIESLIRQDLPKDLYEIIIVDNSPVASAKKVFEKFTEIKNIRYYHERRLGASSARNRALSEAGGEYIAFMDNDTIASPDWLINIIKAFEKLDMSAVCVGGKIEPIWQDQKPKWLRKELETFYSIIDYSDAPIFLDKKHNLFSANMAFPKKFLEEMGGFDTSFGRMGRSLRSGEDVRIQDKMREMGYKIYYDPSIKVGHHILKSRLTRMWLIRRMYHEGLTNAAILIDEKGPLRAGTRFCMFTDEIRWNLPKKLQEMKEELSSEDDRQIFYPLLMCVAELGFLTRLMTNIFLPNRNVKNKQYMK